MLITQEDIKAVSGLLIDLCGIYLDESKGYLIESQLAKLAEEAGSSSFVELTNKVRYSSDPALRNQMIDALTTNETSFFRDESPFVTLREAVLPELIEAKAQGGYGQRLRIWSACCSTGQQAYSNAITICEMLPNPFSWDVTIVESDISDACVRKASAGRFSRHEMDRGMKPTLLTKYFMPYGDGWQVKDELRSISFRPTPCRAENARGQAVPAGGSGAPIARAGRPAEELGGRSITSFEVASGESSAGGGVSPRPW